MSSVTTPVRFAFLHVLGRINIDYDYYAYAYNHSSYQFYSISIKNVSLFCVFFELILSVDLCMQTYITICVYYSFYFKHFIHVFLCLTYVFI